MTAILAVGFVISWDNFLAGKAATSITLANTRELFLTAVFTMLVAPSIWAMYVWQPKGLGRVVLKLYDDGMVHPRGWRGTLDYKRRDERFFNWQSQIGKRRRFWRWLQIGFLVLTIANVAIWEVTASSDARRIGMSTPAWHETHAIYYSLWILLTFLPVYMSLWSFARIVYGVQLLRNLFIRFDVRSLPFHADGANGFAELGLYVRRTAIAPTIIAIWLVLLSVVPLPTGWLPSTRLGYALLVPALLAYCVLPVYIARPLWHAHHVMLHHRHLNLSMVANRINELLSWADIAESDEALSRLRRERELFDLLDRSYRTWPLRRASFLAVGTAYIAPTIVLGLFTEVAGSILIDRVGLPFA